MVSYKLLGQMESQTFCGSLPDKESSRSCCVFSVIKFESEPNKYSGI